jgi:hypothetical protein
VAASQNSSTQIGHTRRSDDATPRVPSHDLKIRMLAGTACHPCNSRRDRVIVVVNGPGTRWTGS